MKRELTDKEKELTDKNLSRNKEKLEFANENLEYVESQLDKQKYLRTFDDKWRPYLRKVKDRDDLKTLDILNEDIKQLEFNIEHSEKQLKEGVETQSG